ncbi:TetR/AcrR family transcriptional regulator [Desertihabitans brevis]|uniref:TetR/AcrR family transcriptional regulator n=1 Tax=Desertihabitans brevis TaxID=2268447 RepID=A0A367YQ81_9ACTN|nr:TetR/AcrR family transcriptional regulator [Desertihabitans brevis]RCK67978.1 TetR/AcrR family transcriptional regulator [Desertihabitans brevis]
MSDGRSTPRQQHRDARTAAIVEVARRLLGEVGPGQLSLRAVARELDLVPSAVYRYFSGRDHILTELITDGYRRLGGAVAGAEDALPRDDLPARWRSVWTATRDWGVRHPHEWALLYGSPVPGYAAPTETVAPATLVVGRLARVVFDARERGRPRPEGAPPLPPGTRADAEQVTAGLPALGITAPAQVDPVDVVLVLDAWTHLVGTVSFELFGHYVNAIAHPQEHLELVADDWSRRLGLDATAA